MVLLAQIGKIGEHVLFADYAAGLRDHQFADVMDGGFPRIDKQAAAAKAFVVSLAHGGRIGADQIDMCAGLDPRALNDGGSYCRTNQISLSHVSLDFTHRSKIDLWKLFGKTRTQRYSFVAGSVPYIDLP